MLATTLTASTGTYTKLSEDAQSGTVYQDLAVAKNIRPSLTVKRQSTSKGTAKQIDRLLISVNYPEADEYYMPTGRSATVNFTVAAPRDIGSTYTNNVINDLLKVLATGFSAQTTFVGDALNGHS